MLVRRPSSPAIVPGPSNPRGQQGGGADPSADAPLPCSRLSAELDTGRGSPVEPGRDLRIGDRVPCPAQDDALGPLVLDQVRPLRGCAVRGDQVVSQNEDRELLGEVRHRGVPGWTHSEIQALLDPHGQAVRVEVASRVLAREEPSGVGQFGRFTLLHNEIGNGIRKPDRRPNDEEFDMVSTADDLLDPYGGQRGWTEGEQQDKRAGHADVQWQRDVDDAPVEGGPALICGEELGRPAAAPQGHQQFADQS